MLQLLGQLLDLMLVEDCRFLRMHACFNHALPLIRVDFLLL